MHKLNPNFNTNNNFISFLYKSIMGRENSLFRNQILSVYFNEEIVINPDLDE